MTAAQRVLVIAEGSTLAHVGRPVLIAEALSDAGMEVVLARPPTYAWLSARAEVATVDLHTQPPAIFAKRLESGAPLYDLATLEQYVAADLALIEDHRPDTVIGDFRLSLSVSARLAQVPYATLCDAYWSPEAAIAPPPLPVLPFTRFVPISVAERLFQWISPIAFRVHARPMEQLRRNHGLPGFGHDMRLAYTDADLRLFASIPALFPGIRSHPGAKFIGPIAWSPRMDLPAVFPTRDRLIYVTMGSSGRLEVLEALFAALGRLPHTVVLASAGRKLPPLSIPPNIRMFDFLPGDEVAARAELIICNGGSPSTNQALRAGVPVLGIAGNMDQMLNMRTIEQAGCGIGLRADRIDSALLIRTLDRLLAKEAGYLTAAQQIGESLHTWSASAIADEIRTLAGTGKQD